METLQQLMENITVDVTNKDVSVCVCVCMCVCVCVCV